jgi:thiosulfate reductase cytochrome b subunit
MTKTPGRRREQPWPIRLSHWLNVPLLVVMAGSGLEILGAFPRMGPVGAEYGWYPLQGFRAPSGLLLGGWLAGARALHFAFAWLLVLNGLGYLAYVFGTGEWRRRFFFPVRDTRNALQTLAYYVRLRREPPAQELYNGLQRLAYTSVILFGAGAVLTGLVMYKPLQLSWLAVPMGGYDGARVLHFLMLALFAAFTAGHLLMVALHPRTVPAMLTGGRHEP